MQPKDVKAPFRWAERRPLFSERVFYVPEYYDQHDTFSFPVWESPEIFGKRAPVFIEFCSGNGAWVLDKALKEPFHHWIAVEMEFERVRKICSKIHNHNLSNLLAVSGEAWTFAHHYLPANCTEGVFINFPDPWPKGKHAKHRLIREAFVKELARILKPGGSVILVTDDVKYCAQMIKQFSSWESVFPDPYYVTEWPDYGTSFFDTLWRGKGRVIHYLQYKKI